MQTVSSVAASLMDAQRKAEQLFSEVENRGFIQPGVTELALSEKVFALADELFGVKKYWHKRIVRAGENTLCPYRENPANLTIQEDDILFLDFGPIFEEWEADLGRTYVLGDDPFKHRLQADLEAVWFDCRAYYLNNPAMTGAELFAYMQACATKKGWQTVESHCGHLVGLFPHETRQGENDLNYICAVNNQSMNALASNGETRHWILEVHLVDSSRRFGGFFEQILDI